MFLSRPLSEMSSCRPNAADSEAQREKHSHFGDSFSNLARRDNGRNVPDCQPTRRSSFLASQESCCSWHAPTLRTSCSRAACIADGVHRSYAWVRDAVGSCDNFRSSAAFWPYLAYPAERRWRSGRLAG